MGLLDKQKETLHILFEGKDTIAVLETGLRQKGVYQLLPFTIFLQNVSPNRLLCLVVAPLYLILQDLGAVSISFTIFSLDQSYDHNLSKFLRISCYRFKMQFVSLRSYDSVNTATQSSVYIHLHFHLFIIALFD